MIKALLKYRAFIFKSGLFKRKYNIFYFALLITALLLFFYRADHSKTKVGILFKATKNDVIQLFYVTDKATVYSETQSISRAIKGRDEYQYLSFDLPEYTMLKNIRLDLGMNKKQGFMDIAHISLKYSDDSLILFDGATINKFALNEFIDRNHRHFSLVSCKGKYDPYLSSTEISHESGDLTQSKGKLPAILLLPFIIALLIYLTYYVIYPDFMTGFYTFASCFFVVLLLLPALNNLFNLFKESNHEKRPMAERPVFRETAIGEFPSKFENYFNDNFGFRSTLVSIGGKLKYYCFGASATPTMVSVGKQDWLYHTPTFYNVCEDPKLRQLISVEELSEKVKQWEYRKTYLEKRGIKFYKAIWPEKQNIYGEYLPWNMSALVDDTLLQLDAVLNFLREKKSDLHIIDVTKIFNEQKKYKRLYFKHDTHWNSEGAFIAYTQLMNVISRDFSELKPLPASDYAITFVDQADGDLSEIIAIKKPETIPIFKLKTDSFQVKELPYTDYPPGTWVFENKNALSDLTLLVNRDSFTNGMIPFLQPHFKKIILFWLQPFSEEWIEKIKPDLYLESNASRYINW